MFLKSYKLTVLFLKCSKLNLFPRGRLLHLPAAREMSRGPPGKSGGGRRRRRRRRSVRTPARKGPGRSSSCFSSRRTQSLPSDSCPTRPPIAQETSTPHWLVISSSIPIQYTQCKFEFDLLNFAQTHIRCAVCSILNHQSRAGHLRLFISLNNETFFFSY